MENSKDVEYSEILLSRFDNKNESFQNYKSNKIVCGHEFAFIAPSE